ncbi:EAL domain-containing protein [Edaphobacter paludis]
MCYIDRSGKYRKVSPQFEHWSGLAQSDLIGRHYTEVMPAIFGEPYYKRASEALSRSLEGEPIQIEATMAGPHRVHYVQTSYSPDFDEHGTVQGVLVLVTDISELKLSEAEALIGKEYLSLAAEAGGMGVWRYDLHADEITGNETCDRLIGLGPADAPLSWEAFALRIHPEDGEGCIHDYKTAYTVDQVYKSEYRIRHHDGSWRWISVSGSFLRDNQGKPSALTGVVFDITDQKTAESRVLKEAQRVQQVLESTTDGVFVLDRDWRFTYLNSCAERALSNGRILRGKSVWECFPEVDRTEFGRYYRQTMIERVPTTVQGFYPEPLNRWYEAHAYPTEEGISVFFRDITESRQMQDRMRLHQQAMEAVPVGISIAEYSRENDDPLVYVNPAFERITGYAASEILGKNCRFLQGRETRESTRAKIRTAIGQGRTANVVLSNYKKDGTRFFNELQISAVRDAEGTPTHLVGIQTDVTERIEARERLATQAKYDALTGIPNRRHFLEGLQQVIDRAARTQKGVAVVYIDLDNLKDVNDSMGHLQGDRLLAEVAQRITSAVRETDKLGRVGGDEFAFFCSGCTRIADLERVLNRILENLSAPLILDGRELLVTASIGYSIYPADASSSEDLLRMADLAMYTAKKGGKNGWRAYSPNMDSGRKEKLEVASGLRRALDKGELFLLYQPRVDAASSQIRSMEALIRWNHPERGLMMPAQFIAIAEETGLITEIGAWVMREALRQNAEWQRSGRRIVPISVNVSAVQFRARGFASSVLSSIETSGLAPELLELELTESLLMDEAISLGPIATLRDHGVRLAIDDFGTGYSGLGYLARFPVNTIKIDRSFTNSVAEGGPEAAICRAIIQLANDLHFTVVAEGIESQNQAEVLSGWGCDELQGFHFGTPMPAEQIEALLQQ